MKLKIVNEGDKPVVLICPGRASQVIPPHCSIEFAGELISTIYESDLTAQPMMAAETNMNLRADFARLQRKYKR
jgi:hypothetical protein